MERSPSPRLSVFNLLMNLNPSPQADRFLDSTGKSGKTGGSNPVTCLEMPVGIFFIFSVFGPIKAPETVDAVGVQPTASKLGLLDGGGGGIRTHVTFYRQLDFESSSL